MATGTGTPVSASVALAAQEQATAYGYGTIAAALFVRASARVRGYTRQTITRATSTTSLRFPFLLPERPVVSVTSVSYTDADGSTQALTATEYEVEGQYVIAPAYKDKLLTVTYLHGFDPLPDDLVEVVCAVASRMAATPAGLAAGIQSESAGGESITTFGSDSFAGVTELTSAEKRVLDRIFPHTRRVPSVAVTM